MTESEQKIAAKKFAADWKGKGYEKGKASRFGCLCYEMYSGWSILNSL